ncbi:hypothetical protein C8J57DRAFT_1563697 [Mycena rebaudengoi]|nr:hypothetical protein C8J57DRAFT_1563697 [Mycena rebaudengoi]
MSTRPPTYFPPHYGPEAALPVFALGRAPFSLLPSRALGPFVFPVLPTPIPSLPRRMPFSPSPSFPRARSPSATPPHTSLSALLPPARTVLTPPPSCPTQTENGIDGVPRHRGEADEALAAGIGLSLGESDSGLASVMKPKPKPGGAGLERCGGQGGAFAGKRARWVWDGAERGCRRGGWGGRGEQWGEWEWEREQRDAHASRESGARGGARASAASDSARTSRPLSASGSPGTPPSATATSTPAQPRTRNDTHTSVDSADTHSDARTSFSSRAAAAAAYAECGDAARHIVGLVFYGWCGGGRGAGAGAGAVGVHHPPWVSAYGYPSPHTNPYPKSPLRTPILKRTCTHIPTRARTGSESGGGVMWLFLLGFSAPGSGPQFSWAP